MNPPLQVVHLGDCHLGVELYGRPDPGRGYSTRVGDFLAALDVVLSRAKDADLLAVPGDIFHYCQPSPTLQREFGQRIVAVAKHTPVVLIPGNHDLPSGAGKSAAVELLHHLEVGNVTVFTQPEVRVIPTLRGPIIVGALPFIPKSRLVEHEATKGLTIGAVTSLMSQLLVGKLDEMATEVDALRQNALSETPAFLMLHWSVSGSVTGSYRPSTSAAEVVLPLSALKNPVWDAIMCNHIHQPQEIGTGQPPVVYAGSLERVDFGEERDPRSFPVWEIERGRATYTRHSTQARPFRTLEITSLADLDGVDVTGAIVRVQYTVPAGEAPLPESEIRLRLAGAHLIASVKQIKPLAEVRSRQTTLTTSLDPLAALELYLSGQPKLADKQSALRERGKSLLAEHAQAQMEGVAT